MNEETLKRIFRFLEDKEQRKKPLRFKLLDNEQLTKEDLIVKGNLYLGGTNITQLPEGLKVAYSLGLELCINLYSLPKGLKVGGWLDLEGSKVSSLPEGLEVESRLFIENTPLAEKYTDEEIRDMIKPGFINGKIIRN
jgi:hypothetical protein